MAKGGGDFILPWRPLHKLQNRQISLLPFLFVGTFVSLLAVITSLRFAVLCVLSDAHPPSTQNLQSSRVPEEVTLALLHFATTPKVPQQTREEISITVKILMERGPCNFLVFGLWHDSLLWATFNYGGRTVFLDESQEWIERVRLEHPQLETYKVNYGTTLGEASNLLISSRELRNSACRADQCVAKSACPLALTVSNGLLEEILLVEWDVIMIDGPRSFHTNSSFPGRMSAIFTSSVMARARSSLGYVDVLLHDVSRSVENEYGREFLCMDNLVSSVGDLWHFRVQSSSSHDFCQASSKNS